ncbi:MAG: type III pantothenate kinase [Planctomycetota bacterium]|jgi:type III pantothenate kinase
MLLAADVGNSGVKIAAFDGEDLVAAVRLPPDTDYDLAFRLRVPPDEVEAVVCVSVSEPALRSFLAGAGRGALVLGRDLPIEIENRYLKPEETGHDRLANAAAAYERAGGAAIAVDLGSAVTVDVVSGDGAFLGGSIAPGLSALAAGLASEAPALPRYDGKPPPEALPVNTADAVRQGVLIGFAGLVDRLIDEAQWAAEGDAPVFLTGGDAEAVAPHLVMNPGEPVPHLTLEGVRLLYHRATGR